MVCQKRSKSRALRKHNVSLAAQYDRFVKLLIIIQENMRNEYDKDSVLGIILLIRSRRNRLLDENLMDREPSVLRELETVECEAADVVE